MSTLRHLASDRIERLSGEHSIGRSRSNRLVLADRRASSRHAMLRWIDGAWQVADLGSHNGTFVDGRKLEPGERVVITAGTRVSFGCPDEPWTLEADVAPVLHALGDDGTLVEASEDLLTLPDAEHPTHLVYVDTNGLWVVETEDGIVPLPRGEPLESGGILWTVALPCTDGLTTTTTAAHTRPLELGLASMTFQVSRDEENVRILLSEGPQSLELPHRAYHYLLLTLARARLEDAALAPAERGWRYRDDLSRGLRIPSEQFNVTIYRARQGFQRLGIAGAQGLIERRRGSGQIRLGPARLQVSTA